MQLPGLSTEPVRVVLEVTWWPHDDSWSIGRRGWRRDSASLWQLEEMRTSATPLARHELLLHLAEAVEQLEAEILETDDPFSTTGAFR